MAFQLQKAMEFYSAEKLEEQREFNGALFFLPYGRIGISMPLEIFFSLKLSRHLHFPIKILISFLFSIKIKDVFYW